VADDNPYNLFVLELLFQEVTDFQVELITAQNGDEAVRAAVNLFTIEYNVNKKGYTRKGEPITHVFLDLHMPIMDGF